MIKVKTELQNGELVVYQWFSSTWRIIGFCPIFKSYKDAKTHNSFSGREMDNCHPQYALSKNIYTKEEVDKLIEDFEPGTGSGVSDHGALTGLSDDDHSQYHNDLRALTWLGTRTADDLPVGSTNLYYTETLFNSSFLGKTTDDLAEGSTNKYLNVENVQDIMGDAFVDSSSIDFQYDDGANEFTAVVLPAGVDHGALGGLTDDDHTIYLLISGTRAMSGNLNMASNSIINVIALLATTNLISARGGSNMEFQIRDTDSGDPFLSWYENTSGERARITAFNSNAPAAAGYNELRMYLGATPVLYMDLHEVQGHINMYKDLDMNGQSILNAGLILGTDGYAIHDNEEAEISAIAEKTTLHTDDLFIIEDYETTPTQYEKKKVKADNIRDNYSIHRNISGEINIVTSEKTTLHNNDLLLLEDSEDTYAKKKVKISNLPAGGAGSDTTAIHTNVDAEISGITGETTPVGTDYFLMEKAASSNAKRSVLGSNLGKTHSHDDLYYTETEVDGFAVKLTGNQTVAGVKTFSDIPLLPATTPSNPYHAVNKDYVDDNSVISQDYAIVGVQLFAFSADVQTGTYLGGIAIDEYINGWNLIDARACAGQVNGSPGTTDIQIVRKRGSGYSDMLSTVITLGSEWSGNDGVIDTSYDDLQTGDVIYFDIDAVASYAKGLSMVLRFERP